MEKKYLEYWNSNLKYLAWLLGVWFFISCVLGIFFADALNSVRIAGFKLGFWIAQQGAIYVFVILIFIYSNLMEKLEDEHQISEE